MKFIREKFHLTAWWFICLRMFKFLIVKSLTFSLHILASSQQRPMEKFIIHYLNSIFQTQQFHFSQSFTKCLNSNCLYKLSCCLAIFFLVWSSWVSFSSQFTDFNSLRNSYYLVEETDNFPDDQNSNKTYNHLIALIVIRNVSVVGKPRIRCFQQDKNCDPTRNYIA